MQETNPKEVSLHLPPSQSPKQDSWVERGLLPLQMVIYHDQKFSRCFIYCLQEPTTVPYFKNLVLLFPWLHVTFTNSPSDAAQGAPTPGSTQTRISSTAELSEQDLQLFLALCIKIDIVFTYIEVFKASTTK